MGRLPRVTKDKAGFGTKIAYRFTRRSLGQIAGSAPDDMIEPLEVMANVPMLMKGYGRLEQAVAKMDHLDKRYRALAELKAATMTGCEYCIDLGSTVARRWGLTEEELLGLARHREASCFSPVDRLVLDYATGMSRAPVNVPDNLFAGLREHFTTEQLVEMTFVIAVENLRGRFNLALDIGAAGFSEGMVCAVPASEGSAG